jgi:U11/U12 small nuclear ribonucleoprotein SNRNP65
MKLPSDLGPETLSVPEELVEGGFGKIQPALKEEQHPMDEDEDEWGQADFISSPDLAKGRLSDSEMQDYSVFKKYDPGEPTSRLYIKNLSKSVCEKDLHHIYGRYIHWEREEEKQMFDVRLMKEGRMKGQAFVTLPSEKSAKQALRETHAFVLHDKPLVVQFARSAKPKESDSTKKK